MTTRRDPVLVFLRSALVVSILSTGACSESREALPPPSAQPEIVEMLRADLDFVPHPADGGGQGWLVEEESDVPAVASTLGRWTIEYEAGPLGIEVGGVLFLQVSPFWGWSTPQVLYPEVPGFTSVTTSAAGVELEPETVDQQLLAVRIGGRRLEAGERVRFVYGDGEVGARADRYAERQSRFWLAVDGNGDGHRSIVPESPSVEVVAGKPAMLFAHLPSTARPGEPVRLTVVVTDGRGNSATEFEGRIALSFKTPHFEGRPQQLEIGAEDSGRATVEFVVPREQTVRVLAASVTEGTGGLQAMSNPLVVSNEGRILWGDLHGHSGLSDGTGVPEDYFRYARDVAALDVVALTDHDHWGVEPLATHPEAWEEIGRQAHLFNDPGRFVTIEGYEWTNWIYGHRHVLYFGSGGEVLSSVDERFEHPRQLWEALRGRDALTFAHHSAGGPVATDWRIPPDPVLEPLTEIVSVHGSSEAPDAPYPIPRSLESNFVRDALGRGYRLGFVGSGDGHDGHPGLTHVASPKMGGLAAIQSDDLTREGILEALRGRRTYATNGPRIVLRAAIDGRPMGSVVPVEGASVLEVSVAGTTAIEAVEVLRPGRGPELMDGEGVLDWKGRATLQDLRSGEFVYVRVVENHGGAAWSSPFFVE